MQRIVDELEALVARRTASIGPRHSGRRLGSLLVTRGYLVERELDVALARQRETGRRLGEVVVEMGLVGEGDVVELLAEQLRLEVLETAREDADPEVARRLPEPAARRLHAVPVRATGDAIVVATTDPTRSHLVAELTQLLGSPVRLCLTTSAVIDDLIDRAYDLQAA